jgi:hypothetical protein
MKFSSVWRRISNHFLGGRRAMDRRRPVRIRGMEALEPRALLSAGGRPWALIEMGDVGSSFQSHLDATSRPAIVLHQELDVAPRGKGALHAPAATGNKSSTLVVFTSTTSTWVIVVTPNDKPRSSLVHPKRAVAAEPVVSLPAKFSSGLLTSAVSTKASAVGPLPLNSPSPHSRSAGGSSSWIDVNPSHEALDFQRELAAIRSSEALDSVQGGTTSVSDTDGVLPRDGNVAKSTDSVVLASGAPATARPSEGIELSLLVPATREFGEPLDGQNELDIVADVPKLDEEADEDGLVRGGNSTSESPARAIGLPRFYDAWAFNVALEHGSGQGGEMRGIGLHTRQQQDGPDWLPQDAGFVELAAGDAAYVMLRPATFSTLADDKSTWDHRARRELDAGVGLFQAFELALPTEKDFPVAPGAEPPAPDSRIVQANSVDLPLIPPPVPDSSDDARDTALRRYYFTGAGAMLVVSGRFLFGHFSDRSKGGSLSTAPVQRADEDSSGFPRDRATVS